MSILTAKLWLSFFIVANHPLQTRPYPVQSETIVLPRIQATFLGNGIPFVYGRKSKANNSITIPGSSHMENSKN